MKLIDLLNKIANGEETPQKIRCWHLHNKITLTFEQYKKVNNLLGNKKG